MSTLALTKGQSLPLMKGGVAISDIRVGLSWDVADIGNDVDLDLFVIHKDSKKVAYFGDRTAIAGVELSGDNRTGAGDGDDEFANFNANTTADGEYMVCLNIYDAGSRSQSFNLVKNAKVTVYNKATNEALVEYKVSEDGGANTGLVVCSLKDAGNQYTFTAKGDYVNGDINQIVDSLV